MMTDFKFLFSSIAHMHYTMDSFPLLVLGIGRLLVKMLNSDRFGYLVKRLDSTTRLVDELELKLRELTFKLYNKDCSQTFLI